MSAIVSFRHKPSATLTVRIDGMDRKAAIVEGPIGVYELSFSGFPRGRYPTTVKDGDVVVHSAAIFFNGTDAYPSSLDAAQPKAATKPKAVETAKPKANA
jgi:hypothetical protein